MGGLYVAVVLDAWSRRIVGWAMAPHMPAELVGDALSIDRAPPAEGARREIFRFIEGRASPVCSLRPDP